MKIHLRKLILLLTVLPLAVCLYAVNNIGEARVYINPGHGGWGSNDRPLATINYAELDTLGFFETNTNLLKGLELRDQLEKAGTDYIRMSRTLNGIAAGGASSGAKVPEMDEGNGQIVTLSVIARDVEENDMDYFISIHSNAIVDGYMTNYPLLLYRGTNDAVGNGLVEARNMGRDAWKYIAKNDITYHSAHNSPTSNNTQGDITFMGSSSPSNGYIGYYAVLKHGCDGYLSEGCFHTYHPERHRLLNKDYCRQEGIRYARAIRAWFGDNTETKGSIMGTVKDQGRSLEHQLYKYKEGSIDQYYPLNNVPVILQNSNGQQIASYTTDKEYNGVFVFNDLNPGNYKLVFDIDGFDKIIKDIQVKANETSFINQLVGDPPPPPPAPCEDFPYPEQDGDIAGSSCYNFTQKDNEISISQLENLTVRRALLRDEKFYILAVDQDKAPKLLVINASTGQFIKEMSTNGLITEAYKDKKFPYILSDIAFTVDGVLIGTNSTVVGTTDNKFQTGNFYVYKWQAEENGLVEDAEPEIMITLPTNTSASIAAAGNNLSNFIANSITVSGCFENFKLYFDSHPGDDWVTTHGAFVRHVAWKIVNGEVTATQYNTTPHNILTLGEDVKMSLSPLGNDRYILDGNKLQPSEWEINWQSDSPIQHGTFNAELPVEAAGANYFRYADRAYMAIPSCEKLNDTYTYKTVLFDITNGLDKSKNVGSTSALNTNEPRISYMTAYGIVSNKDINLYMLAGNKIVKYTTSGVEQLTSPARIFAYNLESEYSEEKEGYTIEFELNEKAESVEFVLINIKTGQEEKSIGFGPMNKGTHQITLLDTEIPETGRFYWSLRATANNVTSFTKLSDESEKFSYFAPKGIAIDNSPVSPYFGRIYITNTSTGESSERTTSPGLYILGPQWDDITGQGNTAHGGGIAWTGVNGEGPRKLTVTEDGRIFIADASKTNAGMYYMDPETYQISTVFTGGVIENGSVKINGTYVGGQFTAIGSRGYGEQTQIYAVDKTTSGATWKKHINIYNIGNNNTWTSAPSYSAAANSYIGNDNNSVVAVSTGYWGAQFRNAGENSIGNPCLFYFSDLQNKAVFNTAEMKDEDGNIIAINKTSQNGGAAVLEKEGLAVFSYDGGMLVLEYTMDDKQIPVVKQKFWNSLGKSGVYYDDFAFDYAGNLYALSNSGKFISVWAMPTSENTCATPAKKSMTIVKGGVEVPGVKGLAYELDFDKLTLTWTEPENPGMEIEEYRIYKDDKLLGSTTETSFIEENLDNGSYVYDVVTVYSEDIEKPKVSINVTLNLLLANIYASELRMAATADGYDFSFVLNEKAREVIIEFTDGTNILGSYNAGSLEKGDNTVSVDKSDIPLGENMHWQVKAIAPNLAKPLRITGDDLKFQFWNSYGVAVDNNPESNYFGRVYVTNSTKGTLSSGRTTNQGIYIFDAKLDDITGQGNNVYGGGIDWYQNPGSGNSNSPYRLSVAPDGRVFMTDYSDANSGIYIMDPENPEANFIKLFDGLTRASDGLATNSEGTAVHGSSSACYITGTGDETKLFTLDEDYIVNGKKINVLQYNIGTATNWTDAPSDTVFSNAANNNYFVNSGGAIVPDGRGGWWISQYRATETKKEPGLIHFNGETIDFSSGDNLSLLGGNSRSGGLAINVDGTRIAMASLNAIKILGITWIDNTPSVELLYSISPALGSNSNGLAFDWAGNVYLVSNSGERLGMWSIPKEINSATTPAKASQLIANKPAGVSNLIASVNFNEVTLTWTAPEGSGEVVEYKVYRDNVWVADVTITSCTESDLDNGSYVYDVIPVYEGAIEGPKESTTAVVNMSCGPVTDLVANVEGKNVILTWNPPTGITATATYNVYRGNQLLENIPANTYTDSDLENGTYTYKVTAVYGNYETPEATANAAITTGLRELELFSKVYPNPTEGIVTIESSETIRTIQVLDLNGRLIFSLDNVNTYIKTIDLSDYDKGVYILKVNDGTSRIIRK